MLGVAANGLVKGNHGDAQLIVPPFLGRAFQKFRRLRPDEGEVVANELVRRLHAFLGRVHLF